jgi:hypothetical protein
VTVRKLAAYAPGNEARCVPTMIRRVVEESQPHYVTPLSVDIGDT